MIAVVNPFMIPDQPSQSYPLCPWRVPEHADYYVAVDNADGAYQEFCDWFDPRATLRRGHLVLVRGPDRCGKTALLHRMVYHAREELRAAGGSPIRLEILDFSRSDLPGDTDDRTRRICKMVVTRLGDLLNPAHRERLEGLTDDPESAYEELSRRLSQIHEGGRVVVAILLPPSELTDEVLKYFGYGSPHLIFFCEANHFQPAGERANGRIRSIEGASALILDLGALNVTDGLLFVTERMGRYPAGNGIPQVAEGTLKRLMRAKPDGMSIAEFQGVLIAVFHSAAQQNKTIVSYSDFGDFYVRIGNYP